MIYKEDSLNDEEGKYITEEVVEYWEENVNPGFLEYRKSVSEEHTAVEWIDGEVILHIESSLKMRIDFD